MRDLERKDGDRGDAERFCLADSGWRGAVKDYVSGAGWWVRSGGQLAGREISRYKFFR
jgi:hypothetical protein